MGFLKGIAQWGMKALGIGAGVYGVDQMTGGNLTDAVPKLARPLIGAQSDIQATNASLDTMNAGEYALAGLLGTLTALFRMIGFDSGVNWAEGQYNSIQDSIQERSQKVSDGSPLTTSETTAVGLTTGVAATTGLGYAAWKLKGGDPKGGGSKGGDGTPKTPKTSKGGDDIPKAPKSDGGKTKIPGSLGKFFKFSAMAVTAGGLAMTVANEAEAAAEGPKESFTQRFAAAAHDSGLTEDLVQTTPFAPAIRDLVKTGEISQENLDSAKVDAGSVLGAAFAGAAAGAVIGSPALGIGAIPGAIIGFGAGIGGYYLGGKITESFNKNASAETTPQQPALQQSLSNPLTLNHYASTMQFGG